jgi:hypothetical protein
MDALLAFRDLPPLVQGALGGAATFGLGLLTYLGNRRLNKITVTEKEANALLIMTNVAANMAKQLEAFERDVPAWRAKVSVLELELATGRAECEHLPEIKRLVHDIVEHISHFSYVRDPGEDGMSSIERRFRAIKDAAARLDELIPDDETDETGP